jgi:hypothetical protein
MESQKGFEEIIIDCPWNGTLRLGDLEVDEEQRQEGKRAVAGQD